MAQTTPRESLTCFAISYFANQGFNGSLSDFRDIVYDYIFKNDDQKMRLNASQLPSSFDFRRIKDLFADKDKALKESKDYPLGIFKQDFPNTDVKPNKLDEEIKSAYSTAEAIHKTSLSSNISEYTVFDQSTDFMKSVKDDPLNKTLQVLELPKDVGSDILSSIDIILTRNSKVNQILREFDQHLTGSGVSNIDILNNLAHGETGQNTFRTITNKYFRSKDMIGISLKKVPSNRKADIKAIGSIIGAKELQINIDPYTEFLARVAAIEKPKELYDFIDELVEITEIKPTDPRAYFSVNFKMNYQKVNIADKVIKFNLQIGRSGFNAAEGGKGGFVGGASYAVTLPVLKRYTKYSSMVSEIIAIRDKAFHFAIDKKKLTSDLRISYNNALRVIRKKELVLYESAENEIIKKFCNEYDVAIANSKDSYQEYRIAVSKLCKNKSLKSPHGPLAKLDKTSNKTTGVPLTLQNDYVHAQGLWMYTRQKEDLKRFFKKQITLTLYGIMSKKGSKVFQFNKKNVLVEDAFVKEFKAKNGRNKIAKFLIAPYVLID